MKRSESLIIGCCDCGGLFCGGIEGREEGGREEGGIEGGDHPAVRFKKGDCLFLPASLGKCILLGETEVLKVRC